MAKNLSRLQREILKLAFRNRKQNPGSLVDISARDILVEVYGFTSTVPIKGAELGALVFNRKAIGARRYQAASVSVAKSFDRLASRGLVEREPGCGVRLTDVGVDVARGMTKELKAGGGPEFGTPTFPFNVSNWATHGEKFTPIR